MFLLLKKKKHENTLYIKQMVKKNPFNPKSLLQSSFQPTLLDAPLRRRRRIKHKQIYFEPLPKPLQPTPYVPPKTVPPPRRKKPVALPRSGEAREVVNPRVEKYYRELTPLYTSQAIEDYRKNVTGRAKAAQREAFKKVLASELRQKIQMKIKERRKGLKGVVQSFELENISTEDPRMLFSVARNSLTEKLAKILHKKGSYKAYLTLRVESKKKIPSRWK